MNTYLALTASAVLAVAVSALVQKNKRFTMVSVYGVFMGGDLSISMFDL